MKAKYIIMFFLSLIYSMAAWSLVESTDDYAYGAELILTDNRQVLSRVSLTESVYTQSVFPDLRDVRVFDRYGNMVPFSLINIYNKTEQVQSATTDLIIYPLALTAQDNNTVGKSTYSVTINGQNIVVNNSENKKQKYATSYLLQFPANSRTTDVLSHLQLLFKNDITNWQATASVKYSPDLKKWNVAINDSPLMSLVNPQGQSLILNEINLPYTHYYADNWLISLSSDKPIPELTNVMAITGTRSSTTLVAGYPIHFKKDSSDGQSAIYSLPASIPIKEFTIKLDDNGRILPVTIYYKQRVNDQHWIKLAEKVVRSTYSDEPLLTMNLANKQLQQIKLEAINTNIYTTPDLVAYRDKVDIVFNSANNGPFILAWGSAQAKSAALPITDLLSKTDTLDNLPIAHITQRINLAGEKVLHDSDSENSNGSEYLRWLIWLGLVMGAGALILLAVKLLKDVKKIN